MRLSNVEKQELPKPNLISEPSDVLQLKRTIDSLERENAWLKERLARFIRDE
jgi:hypothetical protein